MLRFVLKPTADGRFEFEIEGGGDSSKRLQSRVAAVTQAARREGYEFRDHRGAIRRRPERRHSKRKVADTRTVEIVPRQKRVICQRATAGFGTNRNIVHPSADAIIVPDFPAAKQNPVTNYPFAILMKEDVVRQIEVEFVARDLSSPFIESVGKAFDYHCAEMANILGGATPPVTALRTFLGLWLYSRRGWDVRCRVEIELGSEVEGSLEMFGREIFCAECIFAESPDAFRKTTGMAADFSCSYPEGWLFPALLPPHDYLGSVAAERIHNLSLPVLPKKGTVIGTVEGSEVRLPIESRDRHTYIVGATGTGKSTLLRRMIRDDIARGEGVVLIDPHGDLCSEVLDSIPAARRKDVFVLNPGSPEPPPGLNILDIPHGRLRRRHTDFLIGEMLRFFDEVWDMRAAGGPAFEMYFRNTLLLLCLQDPVTELARPDNKDARDQLLDCLGQRAHQLSAAPFTIADFMRVMANKAFREQLLARCSDKSVIAFWNDVAVKTSGDYRLENFVPYVSCKVNSLTQAGFVSQLLCAERNEFQLGERMDRGEIVLLNLDKGQLGAYESRLLGMILMMEIFAAGLQRSLRPPESRRPVNIYVDEFQNFVSDNVASMLSEARKFGLRLTLANQTLAQLRTNSGKQDLLETVLGNVGNMILFRLGVPDSERLRLFLDPFSPREMQELQNFHALARILTSTGPVRPIVMRTLK